jgi:hypothetical protein
MAYYDVLGLDSQCTQEEVKKAYRRLAIKVGFGLSLFARILLWTWPAWCLRKYKGDI